MVWRTDPIIQRDPIRIEFDELGVPKGDRVYFVDADYKGLSQPLPAGDARVALFTVGPSDCSCVLERASRNCEHLLGSYPARKPVADARDISRAGGYVEGYVERDVA